MTCLELKLNVELKTRLKLDPKYKDDKNSNARAIFTVLAFENDFSMAQIIEVLPMKRNTFYYYLRNHDNQLSNNKFYNKIYRKCINDENKISASRLCEVMKYFINFTDDHLDFFIENRIDPYIKLHHLNK